MQHTLAKLFDLKLKDVIFKFPSDLPEATREHQSWAQMLTHIESGLSTKLAFWRGLPHILCGLAHPNPSMAAQIARDAIALWRQVPENQEAAQHRVAQQFLSKTKPSMRGFVEKVANGEPRSSQPLHFQQKTMYALAYSPTAERRIEEKHTRLSRRALARQCSAAYASLILRTPTIEAAMHASPQIMKSLLDNFEKVRKSPAALLTALGLQQHASVR